MPLDGMNYWNRLLTSKQGKVGKRAKQDFKTFSGE